MNDKPKIEKKFVPHFFSSSAHWTGGRTWTIQNEIAPDVPGGPPIDFGGVPDRWTPEDLMLASVNTCHVSTFISLSIRKGFEFVSVDSSIEGALEHNGKGYVFTTMVIHPRVVVKSEADIATAKQYLERAHETCFMGNSVTAKLTMEPEIIVAD
jgi:organic hydroperoxide reductase OsmC/OhrA